MTTIDELGNEVGVPGFAALLRLRQGSSERASWLLDEVLGGTMITVGSDPACDWQIRAAFVPARAFSVLVVGGRAFVRSGPELGVLLNGRPIDDGWTPVPSDARIDVGLARVEVSLGYAGELAEQTGAYRPAAPRPSVGAPHADWVDARTGVHERNVVDASVSSEPAPDYDFDVVDAREAAQYGSPRERGRRSASDARARPSRPAPVEATSRARPSRPSAPFDPQRELEAMQYTESGEYEVAPALLEEDAPKGSFWRYALIIALTAGAYGGWLVLLDRM